MQDSENVVKGTELSPQNILRISSLTPMTLNTLAAGTPVVVVGGGFSVPLQVSGCLGKPTVVARSPWALSLWLVSRERP